MDKEQNTGTVLINGTSTHEVHPEILAKNIKAVNENPETVQEDIDEFRRLILEDKKLHAKLDDEFLLKFLRARKFDKQRALTLIQEYYKQRYNHRDLFKLCKPSLLTHVAEPNMHTFLPHRDHLGRRIGIMRIANWNPEKFTVSHFILSVLIVLENVSLENETQLCGVSCIADAKGITFYQARHISVFDIKNAVVMIQRCFPLRLKEMHVVNEGPLARNLIFILKAFLTKKFRNRIYTHGNNFDSLHQHIPKAILPQDYQGEQPPMDNRQYFQSLLDSDDYFEELLKYGYGKNAANK